MDDLRNEFISRCLFPRKSRRLETGDWKRIRSIGLTITYRASSPENWGDGEVRYFIMSFTSNAERFGTAVRQHWGIENSLHWVMDMTFREDESRIQKDYGAENFSWLRRLAISLLKNNETRKGSIRNKRLRAGYDFNFLLEVLNPNYSPRPWWLDAWGLVASSSSFFWLLLGNLRLRAERPPPQIRFSIRWVPLPSQNFFQERMRRGRHETAQHFELNLVQRLPIVESLGQTRPEWFR